MTTFATPGPIAAIVEVAGSHMRVTASDRTDTVVLVEPVDKASRSDVKVAEKTRVDFAGGQLSVKTTVPGRKGGSVAIAIDLPTGSSLAAYLAHSDVHADGSLGECELHLASGLVRLDRIEGLMAKVTGAVRLSNSGGRAWIGHASADLDLSSGSCDFDIDRADGDVAAATASGAIRIGRMTHGQAKLMNGSGNIEVGIDEGTAAHVDVESERGTVRDSVARQGNPGAAVSVHARTRYGDVIIQRALTGRA